MERRRRAEESSKRGCFNSSFGEEQGCRIRGVDSVASIHGKRRAGQRGWRSGWKSEVVNGVEDWIRYASSEREALRWKSSGSRWLGSGRSCVLSQASGL